MRRASTVIVGGALALGLLLGCGRSDPPPEVQVRETLVEFGKATAAKDYQTLCDRIFAPQLIDELTQIGLPCEVAMQRGFEDVENPRLTIGRITVAQGAKSAKAEVRTSATGQRPSRDTLELVPVDGRWRISSLG